jgi:hypothetical protein
VIETWFDDKFKEYFYTREPLARYLDMGDISEQLAMKERLKCKSFEWFMDNVAYDVYDKFPALPPNLHWGEVSLAVFLNVLKTARKLTNHRVNFFLPIFIFQHFKYIILYFHDITAQLIILSSFIIFLR